MQRDTFGGYICIRAKRCKHCIMETDRYQCNYCHEATVFQAVFLPGDFSVRPMNAPDKLVRPDVERSGLRYVLKRLRSNPEERIFLTIACSVVSVPMMTSIAIQAVETAPGSNILTAEDSIWRAITAVSTVGYGDLYPVAGAGRLIGGALMACGTIVIGAISAYISSWVDRKR